MKQNLFSDSGRFYKVNLHSHTTLSDGSTTPEQTKEKYKSMGYDAVAFTEHKWNYDVRYLNDDEFLAIRAYEYDIQNKHKRMVNDVDHYLHVEHAHFNFFARDPENNKIVCVAREKIPPKFADKLDKLDELGVDIVGGPTFYQEFTVPCLNRIIKTAKENGFVVVYNHPNWSMNEYPLYSKLEGLDGFEMINGATNRETNMGYNPYVYEEMLRTGMRLSTIAAGDDNHKYADMGHAYTMIKSDALTQESIIENFAKGNCYVSEAPEIKELYVEDGVVTIKTSEAKGIFLHTVGRRTACALADEDGQYVTEASFRLEPEDYFFRITVKDEKGRHANTRAYYLDEIESMK